MAFPRTTITQPYTAIRTCARPVPCRYQHGTWYTKKQRPYWTQKRNHRRLGFVDGSSLGSKNLIGDTLFRCRVWPSTDLIDQGRIGISKEKSQSPPFFLFHTQQLLFTQRADVIEERLSSSITHVCFFCCCFLPAMLYRISFSYMLDHVVRQLGAPNFQ